MVVVLLISVENQIVLGRLLRGYWQWQETCGYRFISVQLVPFVPVKHGSQLLKGPVDRGLRK